MFIELVHINCPHCNKEIGLNLSPVDIEFEAGIDDDSFMNTQGAGFNPVGDRDLQNTPNLM